VSREARRGLVKLLPDISHDRAVREWSVLAGAQKRAGKRWRQLAALAVFLHDGQRLEKPPPVLPDESSLFRKNILVSENRKSWSKVHVPRYPEGVSRSSRNVARDAMDAIASQGVRRNRVRSSRVVLSPRRWGQVRGRFHERRWL